MPPRIIGRRPLPRAGKRSGARKKWARLGSNQQPLVCETSALPLSYSPVSDPGQGIEPRFPRSERGVLPVGRSRNGLSVHLPCRGRSTQQAVPCRGVTVSVSLAEAERCCSCHSPTLRPWILSHRLRTCAATVVLRGGALEPEPRRRYRKFACKSTRVFSCVIHAHGAEGLSLSGGASIRSSACSSWASPRLGRISSPLERKRRPVGSPSTGCCAARNLARAPPSEGRNIAEPALRIEVRPARLGRRDDPRFGTQQLGRC